MSGELKKKKKRSPEATCKGRTVNTHWLTFCFLLFIGFYLGWGGRYGNWCAGQPGASIHRLWKDSTVSVFLWLHVLLSRARRTETRGSFPSSLVTSFPWLVKASVVTRWLTVAEGLLYSSPWARCLLTRLSWGRLWDKGYSQNLGTQEELVEILCSP